MDFPTFPTCFPTIFPWNPRSQHLSSCHVDPPPLPTPTAGWPPAIPPRRGRWGPDGPSSRGKAGGERPRTRWHLGLRTGRMSWKWWWNWGENRDFQENAILEMENWILMRESWILTRENVDLRWVASFYCKQSWYWNCISLHIGVSHPAAAATCHRFPAHFRHLDGRPIPVLWSLLQQCYDASWASHGWANQTSWRKERPWGMDTWKT